MTYDLKNFSIEHHTKDAIPETVLFNILDKLVNNNIKLYFNFDPIQLRDLNLDRFLIKKSEISRVFHILHKTKHHDKRFHSVIFNSMSIQFSTNIFVNNDNRFNYLQKYFKFYKKYRMNNDGFIVIYCNNPNGYYKEWINYEKQLPDLIKKIRFQIVVRVVPTFFVSFTRKSFWTLEHHCRTKRILPDQQKAIFTVLQHNTKRKKSKRKIEPP